MIQSLTPDAQQVIVMYNLGMPTAEYRTKFTARKAFTIAILFIAGLGALVMAILGSSSLLLSAIITVLLLAALFLGDAIWLVVDTVRSRDIHIYSCPGGLLYQHSGKTEAIRWDQVESFWRRVASYYRYGIYVRTTHRYTLRRSDGATFKFNDDIHDVEALGNTMNSETSRALWPRYMAAYQTGQTLSFGKIQLNQQGVSKGKQGLAWSQVKELQVNRGGFVSLKKEDSKQSDWSLAAASMIPNVEVFIALVNYVLTSR